MSSIGRLKDTMKTTMILLVCVCLAGCSDNAEPSSSSSSSDAGSDAAPPRNDENTDGGLCCQITNNFQDIPIWNYGFYTCMHTGEPLKAFNPPWICNVTFDGFCGEDSGVECMNCFDPSCVVGLRCRDVNGTGTVIPCK